MSDFFKKYANNKGMYIIIIIGIAFMLISGSGQRYKSDSDARIYDAYSDEERLTNILSKVNGVGSVSVMITYYGTTSYDVAYEGRQNRSESGSQKNEITEKSAVTKGGEPMITGQKYPKVKGVVVIAEGASDALVRKAVTDAAAAALEVASYRICGLEGNERN